MVITGGLLLDDTGRQVKKKKKSQSIISSKIDIFHSFHEQLGNLDWIEVNSGWKADQSSMKVTGNAFQKFNGECNSLGLVSKWMFKYQFGSFLYLIGFKWLSKFGIFKFRYFYALGDLQSNELSDKIPNFATHLSNFGANW